MAILKKGLSGDPVRRLQAKLGVEADGEFGSNTEKALKDWQTKNGLSADGVAGPDTFMAMGLYELVLLKQGTRGNTVKKLQEKLGVHRSECRRLLTRHGVSSGGGTETAATIHRIVSAPLEQLVEELRRTLQFISLQSPQWSPKRLWLMGGGAMIRNLPDFLTTRAGLPTAPWTLDANGGHSADNFDPLYAVATGLSLLAWEADRCM